MQIDLIILNISSGDFDFDEFGPTAVAALGRYHAPDVPPALHGGEDSSDRSLSPPAPLPSLGSLRGRSRVARSEEGQSFAEDFNDMAEPIRQSEQSDNSGEAVDGDFGPWNASPGRDAVSPGRGGVSPGRGVFANRGVVPMTGVAALPAGEPASTGQADTSPGHGVISPGRVAGSPFRFTELRDADVAKSTEPGVCFSVESRNRKDLGQLYCKMLVFNAAFCMLGN